jgi:hypothetical protein
MNRLASFLEANLIPSISVLIALNLWRIIAFAHDWIFAGITDGPVSLKVFAHSWIFAWIIELINFLQSFVDLLIFPSQDFWRRFAMAAIVNFVHIYDLFFERLDFLFSAIHVIANQF